MRPAFVARQNRRCAVPATRCIPFQPLLRSCGSSSTLVARYAALPHEPTRKHQRRRAISAVSSSTGSGRTSARVPTLLRRLLPSRYLLQLALSCRRRCRFRCLGSTFSDSLSASLHIHAHVQARNPNLELHPHRRSPVVFPAQLFPSGVSLQPIEITLACCAHATTSCAPVVIRHSRPVSPCLSDTLGCPEIHRWRPSRPAHARTS